MKKKKILTGLLVVSSALAFVSCDKKNNSDLFFNETSSDLLDDFDQDDLETTKLSLKQQVLLENADDYDSITAVDGVVKEKNLEAVNGTVYEANVETDVSLRLYSNDVFENSTEMKYSGDKLPSYGYNVKKISKLSTMNSSSLPVISSSSLPVISSSSNLPPYSALYQMGGSYSLNKKIAYTNNYSFAYSEEEAGKYGSHTSMNVSTKPSTSLYDIAYDAIPYPNVPYGYTSKEYYKYNNYIVVARNYTYNTTFEACVGYDYSTDSNIYENAREKYTLESYTFFKSTGDSYELVGTYDLLERKTDHIYDEYDEYYLKQDEMKTYYKYESGLLFSTKEVEYKKKDEFVNSFATNANISGISSQVYAVTKDDNENITNIESSYTNSGEYDVISTNGNKFNVDCAFDLYSNNTAKFMVNISLTNVNSKALNDTELSEEESLYTYSSTSVELDVTKYLPKDIKAIKFNDETYVNYVPESSNNLYIVFVNADIVVDDEGNATAKIKSVDFYKSDYSGLVA